MSTEEPREQTPQAAEPEKVERPVLMNPNTRNLIVGTAIVIILLTLTAWSGSIRTEGAKQSSLREDAAALAASFKYPVMESNSMLTSAGKERLTPMLEEVARAGGYTAMTLTDGAGVVLATTNGSLSSNTIKTGDLPRNGAQVSRENTGLKAIAPIMLGDTAIGYLIVETSR